MVACWLPVEGNYDVVEGTSRGVRNGNNASRLVYWLTFNIRGHYRTYHIFNDVDAKVFVDHGTQTDA